MRFRTFALLVSFVPVVSFAVPLPKFPAGAVWNEDVSAPALKNPNSDAMIAWLQQQGGWGGSGNFQIDFSMSVLHADASTPMVQNIGIPFDDYYSPDCDDPGTVPFPLPAGGSIEESDDYSCDNDGGGDCHLLVVDGSTLYESYRSNVVGGVLQSQCAVHWDLNRVYPPEGRGDQCTSVDAAGFPVAPLLFNADEVYAAIQSQGDIGHAIRFILPNNRMKAGEYVRPATHAGGPSNHDANAIPYGSRFRLRADFDINGFSNNEGVRAMLRTLKKYGMVLADGGNIPLTGEVDTYTTHKWNELGMDSHSLNAIRPTDFEVVATDAPIDLTYDCVREDDGGGGGGGDSDDIFAGAFDGQ